MNSIEIRNDKVVVAKLMSGRTGKMKSYVAILLVSIGKENFEEDALEAAVNMINQEFNSCCIAIADTLQRFNIATETGITPDEAYKESLKRGDEWLSRYKDFIDEAFDIPYEVLRWDTLITHPKFQEKESHFMSVFEKDSSFLKAMNESIEEYGKRVEKRLNPSHLIEGMEYHKKNCYSYLQEECVAISLLPEAIKLIGDDTPATIVYPGRPTAILTENHNSFLKKEFHPIIDQYEDYMNWLPYRFNKIKYKTDESLSSVNCEDNSIPKKDKDLDSSRIDYINYLTETQLYSLHELLDEDSIYEFNDYILGFLLEHNLFFSAQSSILVSKNQEISPKSLAYIFSKQITAMFLVVDKKTANQCKANIIRIVKRMKSNKITQQTKDYA
ncbi:hypothetical protein [Legionella yabuuchiae]|uniref:hypothetical protein n=1 Tax=Legionella yabuuchiae TaxID=376727 RepID=UPI001056A6EC|nr:hypothetical protein [Legionella yabuuchiae]